MSSGWPLGCSAAARQIFRADDKAQRRFPANAFQDFLRQFLGVIVFPGFSVSTKWAYENYKVLTNEGKNIKILRSFKQLKMVLQILCNDLENVVTQQYPEIQTIKRTLIKAGACGSLMSGSGSSVFGIFPDKRHAQEALALLGTPANRVFISHSL